MGGGASSERACSLHVYACAEWQSELGAISIFPRLTKQVSVRSESDSESVFLDIIPS